jgi:hypothetical protein
MNKINKKTILVLVLTAVMAVTAYAQQYDSERDFKVESDPNVRGGIMIVKIISNDVDYFL